MKALPPPDTFREDPVQFGSTTTLLAAGLGIPPELALAYATSVLGGLAGPFASLRGVLDERHTPALPLVLVTPHPGRAKALQQVFVEPASRLNDLKRQDSMAIVRDFLDESERSEQSSARFHHRALMDALVSDNPESGQVARFKLMGYRLNRQPSLMVTAPTPETFEAARGSVFDEAPLVFDPAGNLVRQCQGSGRDPDRWRHLAGRIIEGARFGLDQLAGPSSAPRVDPTSRSLTPFLVHLSPEWLAMLVSQPCASRLLEVAILIPTENRPTDPDWLVPSFQAARQAGGFYRDAVRRVIDARLGGGGVIYQLEQLPPGWLEGEQELEARLDALPEEIRRHCAGLYDLPHRLLWGSLVLEDPEGNHLSSWVPGAFRTAHWCVDRQVALIRATLEAERFRQQREAAVVMFQKLTSLPQPCRLADVARRFHHQRRELHLPVLELLDREGVLAWRPEANQIELLTRELPERFTQPAGMLFPSVSGPS